MLAMLALAASLVAGGSISQIGTTRSVFIPTKFPLRENVFKISGPSRAISRFDGQVGYLGVGRTKGGGVSRAISVPNLKDIVESASSPPPYVYFCYLLAAGLGFPLPEDSMVIFVGMQIAKGLQEHIWATLAAIYIGVIVSDWMPFLAATLARRGIIRPNFLIKKSALSLNLTSPSSQDQPSSALARAARVIRASGRWVGVIARFSPGLRTPLFLTAGLMGVTPLAFCVGSAIGTIGTMTIQLAIGVKLAQIQLAQGMDGVKNTLALLGAATAILYTFGAVVTC
ncbi:hypothetical protein AAMO2058_000989600 [Amorphochlora amoebiformis]